MHFSNFQFSDKCKIFVFLWQMHKHGIDAFRSGGVIWCQLNLADWYCAKFFGTDVADPYAGSGAFLDDQPTLFRLFVLDMGINQQKDGIINLEGQSQISNTVFFTYHSNSIYCLINRKHKYSVLLIKINSYASKL